MRCCFPLAPIHPAGQSPPWCVPPWRRLNHEDVGACGSEPLSPRQEDRAPGAGLEKTESGKPGQSPPTSRSSYSIHEMR